MKKKAQGMPINVIIVAAIALIVLVVLVAIFTGRLGIFGQKVAEIGKDCEQYTLTIGESTVNADWQSDPCEEGYATIFAPIDADKHPGENCCLQQE